MAGTDAPRLHEPLEAARVLDRFERLLDAGLAISAEHDIAKLLHLVLESARTVVGARYAALGLMAEDGKTLARFEVSGVTAEEVAAMGPPPTGHGLVGVLMREGRPIRLPRISDDPRRIGFPPNHPPMESFLGVPIVGRGLPFGNLYLTEKIGASEFTDEDERIAVMLAAYAATAVETARLIERRESLLNQVTTMQRQRDQFFAMVNHELRNSLTGVYGWAEQLQRARTPEGVEKAGREVFECAERTFTLLNNLLDLSRLDAGKSQPLLRPVHLAERIAAAVASVGPAAEKKQISIVTEGAFEAVTLRTDAVKLEQILVNLLTNAVRHSPARETVLIRVDTLGHDVLINVIDRGPGISQEDQRKIFEMYVRVDPESGLGSGLGLPVSRRLAELLGGRLSVSSDLGRGATFTLSLPLNHAAV